MEEVPACAREYVHMINSCIVGGCRYSLDQIGATAQRCADSLDASMAALRAAIAEQPHIASKGPGNASDPALSGPSDAAIRGALAAGAGDSAPMNASMPDARPLPAAGSSSLAAAAAASNAANNSSPASKAASASASGSSFLPQDVGCASRRPVQSVDAHSAEQSRDGNSSATGTQPQSSPAQPHSLRSDRSVGQCTEDAITAANRSACVSSEPQLQPERQVSEAGKFAEPSHSKTLPQCFMLRAILMALGGDSGPCASEQGSLVQPRDSESIGDLHCEQSAAAKKKRCRRPKKARKQGHQGRT